MKFQVKFDINEKISLRDPESSELGRLLVEKAIDLIYQIGFEQFNFKKLAVEINSTEASIYRYFENKYCLLLYIVNWYWCYIEFLLTLKIENVSDNKERLKIIIHLLTFEFIESENSFFYDMESLHKLVIYEGSKVYLVKDVSERNDNKAFKPYVGLCTKIAEVITSYDPRYQFPQSLSSTLIETAQRQKFFCINLPELTDISFESKKDFTYNFLKDMLFKALRPCQSAGLK